MVARSCTGCRFAQHAALGPLFGRRRQVIDHAGLRPVGRHEQRPLPGFVESLQQEEGLGGVAAVVQTAAGQEDSDTHASLYEDPLRLVVDAPPPSRYRCRALCGLVFQCGKLAIGFRHPHNGSSCCRTIGTKAIEAGPAAMLLRPQAFS
jgi:hypothetical protein